MSMIGAYYDTFNHDFWLGKHPTLWPHQDPESEEGRNYLTQLGHLRHELEWCVNGLKVLMKSNEQLREKIESFREQLYSGSSVKNNRTAIEQGENIKILTGVSMLFLPLTFVTVSGLNAYILPFRYSQSSNLVNPVGVWHANVQYLAKRLAIHCYHDHRLCAFFHLDLCPPDPRRNEHLQENASFCWQISRRLEATLQDTQGKALSAPACSND